MRPPIRYATSGDLKIAYCVLGDAPVNFVFAQLFASHLELAWEEPSQASFINNLGTFSRVLCFDRRGTGLSDRTADPHTPEDEVADLRAVMDAVGMERAVLFGLADAGPACIRFALEYPERTASLILFNSFARLLEAPHYPEGWTQSRFDKIAAVVDPQAEIDPMLSLALPSLAEDEWYRIFSLRYFRSCCSPGTAKDHLRAMSRVDVRSELADLTVSTLILSRIDDQLIGVEHSRYLASAIPGARLVELSGADHAPWVGDSDLVLKHLEQFVTGGTSPVRRRASFGTKSLTSRELAVLRLVCEGYSSRQIGTRLRISSRTAEAHVAHAYQKLGIRSRLELIRRASEFGLDGPTSA